MREEPSTAFSNGTEYAIFLDNFCTRCKKGLTRKDGFAEFPVNGGCPIWDAMENARFGGEFPSDSIVRIVEGGKIKYWNVCKAFEADEVELMTAYRGLFEEVHNARQHDWGGIEGERSTRPTETAREWEAGEREG